MKKLALFAILGFFVAFVGYGAVVGFDRPEPGHKELALRRMAEANVRSRLTNTTSGTSGRQDVTD